MLRGKDFLEMTDEDLVERSGDKMLYGEQAKAALAVRNAKRVADSLDAASTRMEQSIRSMGEAEGRFRESVAAASESVSRAVRTLTALTIVLVLAALLLGYATWRLHREAKALRLPSLEPQGRTTLPADTEAE